MSNPTLKLLVGSWHLLHQTMAFGNPTAGGYKTMDESMRAVAKLNKKLKKEFGIEFAVSAHWWHELRVPKSAPKIGYSAKWNNPRSISLDAWIKGVKEGYYPRIGRIIPPGFGLPGSDDGALINPDPKRRQLAHDMMVYSFQQSERVISLKVGEGNVIFWTGPDGIRWNRLVEGDDVLLGHDLNPKLDEWKKIVGGIGNALRSTRKKGYDKTKLLIEGKSGGDPCYLDVFTDTTLEIRGIKEMNEIAGDKIAFWQGELCHNRGGGQKFAHALQQAIDADVFDGQIHFNSGGLGAVSFTELLSVKGGTPISKFQQYVDPDFLPGEGVKEWLEDQKRTLKIGAFWSEDNGKPFEVEFDARFCRYKDTIGALERSARWTIAEFFRD